MGPTVVTEGAEQFTANAYLVPGETNALIDVGTPPGVADRIAEHIDELDAIYLTHTHGDHIQQLERVVNRFDPAVYAYGEHALRTHTIEEGDRLPLGDTRVRALHTPGHAEDHLVFFDDRWLFSGDIVVYNDGAFDDGSFGRTDVPGANRETLIDSIERILDETPDSIQAMYPGHGDVYEGDIKTVIQRSLERASRREPKYQE